MCKRSNSFSWLVLIERSSLSMLIALLSIRWNVHKSYNCWRLNNDNSCDLIITQNRVYLDRFASECSGGYREGETPGPIPNPEAKTLFAHNTASFRCGNVGRRLASELQLFFLIFLSLITLTWYTPAHEYNFIFSQIFRTKNSIYHVAVCFWSWCKSSLIKYLYEWLWL